jgi:hypothetical protein
VGGGDAVDNGTGVGRAGRLILAELGQIQPNSEALNSGCFTPDTGHCLAKNGRRQPDGCLSHRSRSFRARPKESAMCQLQPTWYALNDDCFVANSGHNTECEASYEARRYRHNSLAILFSLSYSFLKS